MFNRRRTLNDRKVLVNLCSGNAIGGVCVHDSEDVLILRGATIHEPQSEPAAADGEIQIDRINVDFIQVL